MSDNDVNKEGGADQGAQPENSLDFGRVGKVVLGAALLAADKVRETIARSSEEPQASGSAQVRANDARPRKRRMKRKRGKRVGKEESVESRE